jgi:hypothetical protein
VTEPTELTGPALDAAIIAAARELIAARRARDPQRSAAAQAAYDELVAVKSADA